MNMRGSIHLNPIDVMASAYGTGALADSGWVTTTNANDLLVGIELTGGTATGPGPGYTARQSTISGVFGTDLLEDQPVSTTGPYHASAATDSPSIWWIMQIVALRLAGGGDTNTQALTAPSGLAATVASSGQVNLGWTGSTDNIGVTGYLIERCAGAGCADFVQVASVGAGVTSYCDVGLAAATSYTYRVRATDVATLMSAYSTVVSVVTAAASSAVTYRAITRLHHARSTHRGLATNVVNYRHLKIAIWLILILAALQIGRAEVSQNANYIDPHQFAHLAAKPPFQNRILMAPVLLAAEHSQWFAAFHHLLFRKTVDDPLDLVTMLVNMACLVLLLPVAVVLRRNFTPRPVTTWLAPRADVGGRGFYLRGALRTALHVSL